MYNNQYLLHVHVLGDRSRNREGRGRGGGAVRREEIEGRGMKNCWCKGGGGGDNKEILSIYFAKFWSNMFIQHSK